MPSNDRVNRTLKRLGLGDLETGRVERFLSADAEDAAEIVRKSLERFIEQISKDSASDALKGYTAKKQKGTEIGNTRAAVRRRLQRSGAELTADIEWIVYVEASGVHQRTASGDENGLNLFNILDSGRKRLPHRAPTAPPYPLFNLGNSRFEGQRSGAGGASISNAAKPRYTKGKKIAQRESRVRTPKGQPGEGYIHKYDPNKETIVFSRGPLKAMPAQNLYQRALKQAKDDLSGSGFKDWDVIYVGPLRK